MTGFSISLEENLTSKESISRQKENWKLFFKSICCNDFAFLWRQHRRRLRWLMMKQFLRYSPAATIKLRNFAVLCIIIFSILGEWNVAAQVVLRFSLKNGLIQNDLRFLFHSTVFYKLPVIALWYWVVKWSCNIYACNFEKGTAKSCADAFYLDEL